MTTRILSNYDTLARATADLIANYLGEKKDAWVCIASGHTPVGVFKSLTHDVRHGKLDVSLCKFFSLDEWIGVDPQDPGSCLSMLNKDFFDPLNIPQQQIESFNVQAENLHQECARINTMITRHGGLDIMLVGVGTNGHIGMNEPGTSFNSYAHVSDLAEETKKVGQKYFSQPTALSKGITLGLRHLSEAKLPIVMANGNKKADIMRMALTEVPTEQIPVTIIQRIPQGYVMLDKEAAAMTSVTT